VTARIERSVPGSSVLISVPTCDERTDGRLTIQRPTGPVPTHAMLLLLLLPPCAPVSVVVPHTKA